MYAAALQNLFSELRLCISMTCEKEARLHSNYGGEIRFVKLFEENRQFEILTRIPSSRGLMLHVHCSRRSILHPTEKDG
jgi:hypothetical protein